METQLVGAIKVKDGLFIGDQFSAQDLEFIVSNKVTSVVNCCARQVANHWEPIGVKYLSFAWFDHDSQTILQPSLKNFHMAYQFIQRGLAKGESVLVHSVRGRSRSACLISAYLIYKFKWTFRKTLDFLSFRRPDLDLKPNFQKQLQNFEEKILKKSGKNDDWDSVGDDPQEVVLANTFLNSRVTDFGPAKVLDTAGKSISWIDSKTGQLNDQTHPQSRNQVQAQVVKTRSCLKGADKSEVYFPVYREPAQTRNRTGLLFNQAGSLSNTLNHANNLAEELTKELQAKKPRLSLKTRSRDKLKKPSLGQAVIKNKVTEFANRNERRPMRGKRPTSAPQKRKVQNSYSKFPSGILRRMGK